MNKKYGVELSPEERTRLEYLVRTGRTAAATQTRARILRKADRAAAAPAWSEAAIAEALEVSVATVERVRRRFVAEGLEAAPQRQPTTRPPQWQLDGAQQAQFAALACSDPPAGAERWPLTLLADTVVAVRVGDAITRETVRVALKRTPSSRG